MKPKLLLPGILWIVAGYLLFVQNRPKMAIATITYYCLVMGLVKIKSTPRDLSKHVLFMKAGIVGDLALVLFIQYQKSAIQTALAMNLSFLQQAHIACSTLATVLYIPVLILGVMLTKSHMPTEKRAATKKWHLRLGPSAFLFRSLGYLLMFSMLDNA